jgi:hypothetical protein
MVISGARRLPVWTWCVGLALVISAVSGVLLLLAVDGHLARSSIWSCWWPRLQGTPRPFGGR